MIRQQDWSNTFYRNKGYKDGRYTRLYFETTKIYIGQKIHDALLTASMQFMREWAMDVYMEN
jgi:hypothetical protein